MEFIQQFISEEIIYALGWTVVHSLWQGLFIAIIMALILQSLRERSAKLRYEIAGLSLFLILVLAVSTFILLYDKAIQNGSGAITLIGQAGGEKAAAAGFIGGTVQACIAYFNDYMPIIVFLWLVGVAFFMLRMVGGLAYVQKIKYSYNEPLAGFWQKKFQGLASRIPLNKPVELLESAMVKVPMVIGYFKPVILMPVGAVNNLSEDEVEAILAHELGHIFRNDFILNIALSFIEVLFYFNPAVWWISANIRLERENCSDDIAIKLCGDSLAYAKALVKLQELNKHPVPSFAMTFSGSKNQLLNRIQRILNQPQNRSNIMEKLTATSLLLVAIFLLSVGANTPFTDKIGTSNEVNTDAHTYVLLTDNGDFEIKVETKVVLDTIPKGKRKGTIQITTDENGEKVELKMKDGEIVELKVNGEEIPDDEYADYEGLVENLLTDLPPAPPAPPHPPMPPTPPSPPDFNRAPPSPPSPPTAPVPSFFESKKNTQTITKEKNEAGQTVIIIESIDGRNPMEIVIDGEEDVIFIDGSELEDGDTAIIIDELHGLNYFDLFDGNKESGFHLYADTFEFDKEGMGNWLEHLDHNDTWAFESRTPHFLYKFDNDALKKWNEKNEGKIREYMDQLKAYDLWTEANKQNKLFEWNTEGNSFFDGADLHDYLVFPRENNFSSTIEKELLKDGLIESKDDYRLELSQKRMKVNGEKQPDYIHQRYLELYESISSSKLTGKSKLSIQKNRD